jgi:hypothetical protein
MDQTPVLENHQLPTSALILPDLAVDSLNHHLIMETSMRQSWAYMDRLRVQIHLI